MKLNKRALIIAGAVSALALAACDATKEASQATKNPAAATVDGKPISQRTVDMIVAQGAASGRPDTPEARKGIIRASWRCKWSSLMKRSRRVWTNHRSCRANRCSQTNRAGQRLCFRISRQKHADH